MIILTDFDTTQRVGSIDKISRLLNCAVITLATSFGPLKMIYSAVLKLRKHKSITLAIAQPEINLTLGFILKLMGKRLALYVPELYDDRPIARFLLARSKKLYETVIIPSHQREMVFCARYFVPSKTIIVANDSYQVASGSVHSANNVERGGFVYTGVIYPSRPLDNIIQSAKIHSPDDTVYLYGKGDEVYISLLCSKFGCKYMGEFKMEDEVQILSKFKYALLSYPMTSLNNTFCAPNKVFSYKAAGCSIFCDSPNNLRLEIMIDKTI